MIYNVARVRRLSIQNFKSIHAKLKKIDTAHAQLCTLQLRSKT